MRPIWTGVIAEKTYRPGIDAAYKRSSLRVISTLLTSTDAVMVIAGMVPLKLVIDIERRKHDKRKRTDLLNPVQIAEDAMDKWHQDWANSNKGRLTYTLIPRRGMPRMP